MHWQNVKGMFVLTDSSCYLHFQSRLHSLCLGHSLFLFLPLKKDCQFWGVSVREELIVL